MSELEKVFELEQSGELSSAKKLLEEMLHDFCIDGNSLKMSEVLSLIRSRKAYKQISAHYQLCLNMITGKPAIESFEGFRQSYFDFYHEQKSLNKYRDVLLDIFKIFSINIDLLKNEIQLINFLEKVIQFDDQSRIIDQPRVLDFRRSWIIKQLALYTKDSIVLNFVTLAMVHASEVLTAKSLYLYMVHNKITISQRVKYWVEKNHWEVENLYKKEIESDPTQLFDNEIKSLEIDELLRNSEKPFVSKDEYQEILSTYNLVEARPEATRNKMEDQLIISYGDQGINNRVNFYLENGFIKQGIQLIKEQIHNAEQCEEFNIEENLSWFHLALLALLMKNDYNGAIEFSDKYEHYWKLLGVKAVDLWYLSAEANFYSGHFEKAQHYYLQISKFSPDYRLTKGRLEEIKAHK